jgi:hypothetical protein
VEKEMSMDNPQSLNRTWIVAAMVCVIGIAMWWFFKNHETSLRGEALGIALRPLLDKQDTEQSQVARAILDNYVEIRFNALRWSGIYWGFTFLAAIFSASAGLILKFETVVKNESAKKDLAVVLSVAAALLISISTSGDFQRKWQANRIAAAELERTGYELLEKNGADPRKYYASIAQILHTRNVGIVGSMGERKPDATEGTLSATN